MFRLQNTTALQAQATVEFRNKSGELLGTRSITLCPNQTAGVDLSQEAGLGQDFEGSARITVNQAVVAMVDEYNNVRTQAQTSLYLPFLFFQTP